MAKSVLITGGAGFIGSHLVDRCLSLGWDVTAVDAFTDYYDEPTKRRNIENAVDHPNYSLIEGDLLELDLLPIVRRASVVFHLAAQPGVRSSWHDFSRYTRANVDATQRLLEAVKSCSIERFVFASSSSVYGDAETLPTPEERSLRPVSPYGVTKVTTEHLAQVYWNNWGVPTVGLRYFTVYGPRQRPDMAFYRLITSCLAGEAFEVFGDGEQTRDFTFVDDAVNGTVAAAERGSPGSIYNIGGGSRRSMNSVFGTLEKLTGTPLARAYLNRQAGDARDTAADTSRARYELGFTPSVDFEVGLEAQLDWQRASLISTGQGR